MEKPVFVMSPDIAVMLGAVARQCWVGLERDRPVLIAEVNGAIWAWPLDRGALVQAGTA